jgi:hypothetical protein
MTHKTYKQIIEEFDKEFTRDDGLINKYYYDEDGQVEYAPVMIKRFFKSQAIKSIEEEIKYWKNIFDNPPKRDRPYPCDNCTKNICRIEIERLETQKKLIEEDII